MNNPNDFTKILSDVYDKQQLEIKKYKAKLTWRYWFGYICGSVVLFITLAVIGRIVW